MKVKYVIDCQDDCFTLNREYDYEINPDGLMITDDLGREHIIATKSNEYNKLEEDDFFRGRFIFV